MSVVNLGVIGLGRGFVLTLPALIGHPGIRLAAAFDLREQASERFATEFGATAYASVDALVADPTIDAVYVATPHEVHMAQSIAALTAGKHVLVEKPMATNVGDAAAMARAACAADRVLMVGPSHGFDAPVRMAADLIASGSYGAVRLVTAFNFTDFMYRPRRPEELDTRRGGGVVFSQAAHQIDVVRRLIGQPVASVRAITGNWDAGRGSEGAYTALMAFAGGAAATLTYSGYAHYDSDELLGWISELGQVKDPEGYGGARRALATLSTGEEALAKMARAYGSEAGVGAPPAPHHEHFGFVLVSCERADLKLLATGIEIYADDARTMLPIAPPQFSRAGVIDDFLAAIHTRSSAVHNGDWGLETMACCAALLESSRRSAEIDPRTMINLSVEEIQT